MSSLLFACFLLKKVLKNYEDITGILHCISILNNLWTNLELSIQFFRMSALPEMSRIIQCNGNACAFTGIFI